MTKQNAFKPILITHLLFSGLLVSYGLYGKLHKTNGRFNYLTYLIRLWLKYAVPMFIVLLLFWLFPLTGDGPIWNYGVNLIMPSCKDNYSLFSSFFFFSNYRIQDHNNIFDFGPGFSIVSEMIWNCLIWTCWLYAVQPSHMVSVSSVSVAVNRTPRSHCFIQISEDWNHSYGDNSSVGMLCKYFAATSVRTKHLFGSFGYQFIGRDDQSFRCLSYGYKSIHNFVFHWNTYRIFCEKKH